jgi:hypothetical protein
MIRVELDAFVNLFYIFYRIVKPISETISLRIIMIDIFNRTCRNKHYIRKDL